MGAVINSSQSNFEETIKNPMEDILASVDKQTRASVRNSK
jgi:hypothetical protein